MNRRTALKLGVAGIAGALLAGSGILQGCAAFGKKRKAIAINGSARKDMNTAKLLEKAMEGAQSEGAEVELFHLYDYTFKGCVSCLRCKRKDEDLGGLCAYKDSITPLLEKCLEADAIIIGSPIYYDSLDGQMRCFLERLMFPLDPYSVDEQGRRKRYSPVTPTSSRIIPAMMRICSAKSTRPLSARSSGPSIAKTPINWAKDSHGKPGPGKCLSSSNSCSVSSTSPDNNSPYTPIHSRAETIAANSSGS